MAAPSDSSGIGPSGWAAIAVVKDSQPVGGSSVAGHQLSLQAGALGGGGLGDRLPGRGAEQHPGPGVGDDVGDLVGGQVGIDQRVVQPGPLGAALDLQQFRAVLHEHRDVVAALQPGGAQQLRDPVAGSLVLGERHRLAGPAHDDGGLVRMAFGMLRCVHAYRLISGGRQCSRRYRRGRPAG